MHTTHSEEVAKGTRFQFGENWKAYLSTLDEERIRTAANSLKDMLQLSDFSGKTFLDIGCGSGVFSLAARGLGAKVHSLDFDPQSVACAIELKRNYFPDDRLWQIEEGSALDPEFMTGLGQFDIVYSWGVLHHTGHMREGIKLASLSVKAGGLLFLAIYNDQGGASKR